MQTTKNILLRIWGSGILRATFLRGQTLESGINGTFPADVTNTKGSLIDKATGKEGRADTDERRETKGHRYEIIYLNLYVNIQSDSHNLHAQSNF